MFLPPSGSPAELCRLRVDDEIVAVSGVAVTNMNYNQWKDRIASCMQTGTLTMDIRRYGIKGKMMYQRGQLCLLLHPEIIWPFHIFPVYTNIGLHCGLIFDGAVILIRLEHQ